MRLILVVAQSASLHEKLKDLSSLAVVSSLNCIYLVCCFCKQAHSPSALETKETQQQLSPDSPGTEVTSPFYPGYRILPKPGFPHS
jgi:hypothetical protein